MGDARLPPLYANIPTWLLFEVRLPHSVRLAGMRIYALGWQHNYEYTDPVTFEELCAVCELKRSQMYDHLCRLASKGVLRYTLLDRPGYQGLYVFDLRPARTHARDGPGGESGKPDSSPENRTDPALLVVVDSSPDLSDSERSKILEEREQQQQVISCLEGGGLGGGGGESGKPDWAERLAVLDRMKVLEPTRSEIAGLEWATARYLEAWEDWWVEEFWSAHFDGSGLGLVIEQVRAGIEAPASRVARRLERYAEQFGEWW